MKKILFTIGLCLISLTFFSQNLYMPLEFVKAYEKKTRSFDGKPGDNYFSNSSDYKINANLDPYSGEIYANQEVIYYNNSLDTLQIIVIRLYQNIFKEGFPRDFAIDPKDLTKGVEINSFSINGIEVSENQIRLAGSNMIVNLNETIKPQSSTLINLDWQVKLPNYSTIRSGKYGDNYRFVGYWYPQIAVYDDVFGWDTDTHSGAVEFYNNHSNFDVKIRVPNPFIIWATGELQNIDEVFKPEFSNRLKNSMHSDEVINIIKQENYSSDDALRGSETNTFHFIASKVPDFAFAVSDKHNWDAANIDVPFADEKILVNAVYLENAEHYKKLAEFTRLIIDGFSTQIPAITYPYPVITIFQGSGGMEFPMMSNQRVNETKCQDYYLTAHEIGHTYFPFYTGLNETRYAWMDEGLITYLSSLLTDEIWGNCNAVENLINNYKNIAGNFNDLPIMTPSSIYRNFWAYRATAYYKSAFAIYQLHQYLGDEIFFGALQEFANRWAYKNAYPYDFFYTVEDYTNEDLSWFWKPYYFEFAKPDLSIAEVKFDAGLYFKIINNGGLPIPVFVEIIQSDGTILIYKNSIDCWKNSNQLDVYINIPEKPKKIKLHNDLIPDINQKNNIFIFN
jgi:hypothetical protein